MTNELTRFIVGDTIDQSTKQEANMNIYPVSELAANEWKNFALYTVESRAIPNMVDGMKPVQRFYLYSSIKNSKTEFKKVSAVAGVVSGYGYNHAETSAAAAGQLMAADWANNVCLVEGRGSFGSRLIQEASAPRYTYTRLHKNFNTYIKDIDLAPVHDDPEHEPPAFYLPVIPLVLANGTKGIATGFATNILPRSPVALVKACKEYIKTGKIKTRLPISFPEFTGSVVYNEDEQRFVCYGTIDRKSKTELTVTEVPFGYDREAYVQVLDKLEDAGDISRYTDLCDKSGFKFDVKLTRQTSGYANDKLMTLLKLVKPMSENITVIDEKGRLKEYTDERELIKDFCDYRATVLQKRIDLRLSEYTEEHRWLTVKMEFIQAVLDDKIKFKGYTKAQVSENILDKTSAIPSDCDRLLRLNIMSLTAELVIQLANELLDIERELKFWSSTTPKDQFLTDLDELPN